MKKPTEQFSFKGKHILLTGASGGLGSSLVKALSEMGSHMVISSRSSAILERRRASPAYSSDVCTPYRVQRQTLLTARVQDLPSDGGGLLAPWIRSGEEKVLPLYATLNARPYGPI